MTSRSHQDLLQLAGYSLYYSSLALLITAMLAMAADLLWHHDVFNYRIILPLNTCLLLTIATVLILAAGWRKKGIMLLALVIIALVLVGQLAGVNIDAALPPGYQHEAIATVPPLQQLYWLRAPRAYIYRPQLHRG